MPNTSAPGSEFQESIISSDRSIEDPAAPRILMTIFSSNGYVHFFLTFCSPRAFSAHAEHYYSCNNAELFKKVDRISLTQRSRSTRFGGMAKPNTPSDPPK